ncbi:hypothetical protein Tco_0238987 [Tanacetum coccineum]
MKDIRQPIDVVLNNRIYPIRLFEDSSLNSNFFRDLGRDWHNKTSEGSLFEEEFIGPSMDVHDDGGDPMEDDGDDTSRSNGVGSEGGESRNCPNDS